jgi:type IV secretory pathway VirB3-like protein
MHVLHKSITERERILAIPVTYFYTLCAIAYVIAFIIRFYYLLILCIPIYIAMRIFSKKDPYNLDIFYHYYMDRDKYYA